MLRQKALVVTTALLLMFLLLSGTAYAYSGTGTVNCSGYLNIREAPGTSSKIVGKLYPGTRITIEDSSDGWYSITYNGIKGWVCGTYVLLESSAASTAPDSEKETAQKIADYAQKYLGVRYVYGGASEKGFDCSGLVQFIFGKFGIALNRTASSQVMQGTAVEKSGLKPGDLVFFDTNGGHNNITHVGIYIGDNRFVHAESGSVRSVRISSLYESYYARNYMTARRIVN